MLKFTGKVSLDFETKSELDLTKVGTGRYTRHRSTEPLMLAYAYGDDPVEQWVPAVGERMPRDLKDMLRDPQTQKQAWNAAFERQVFANTLGIDVPFEQWRCVMVLAHSLSFPGSLEKVGAILGLSEDQAKQRRGKALIRMFCGPRKPTKAKPWTWSTPDNEPEAWEEFLEYNRQDVIAERVAERKMRRWDMPDHEWDLWHLDQRINEAGIPVNMAMVRNAIKVSEDVTAKLMAEMREITGLDNPNSTAQLLPWLQSEGYPYGDLKKGHVARALKQRYDDIDEGGNDLADIMGSESYLRTLEMRQEVSKASVKKYAALDRAVDDDGMLRNAFQFAGASRTWRWGGRVFQPQNLPRPAKYLEDHQEAAARHVERLDAEALDMLYPRPLELLSSCVRPAVQAPPGKLLADADLNAIENRVLGWVADCQKILDVFREGRCPYLDFATYMYRESYDDLWLQYKAGNKSKRTIAKPAVLGCGYMLSAGEWKEDEHSGELFGTGLLGYAADMGVQMNLDEAARAVAVFRDTFEEVKQFWWDIDRAVRRVIATGQPARLRMLLIDRSGPFLRIHLPSGRCLHYLRPKLLPRRTPWGEMKNAITYEGLNDKKQWCRIVTHPGKLTENVVQAIARDLLAHGMTGAAEAGLDIRLHVHDQITALVDAKTAESDLELLKDCMSDQPPWAEGLPLAAEGFLSPVFIKD